jgi:hypothetical protein
VGQSRGPGRDSPATVQALGQAKRNAQRL